MVDLPPEYADVVILGTGPLSLIEGLRLRDEGRDVCFIDSSTRIGGSWRVTSFFGYENVETGVHLIENRPLVNRWLRSILDDQVIDQNVAQDFGLWAGKRIPINVTRLILHSFVLGKAVLKGRFSTVARIQKSTIRAALNLKTECIYPKGGFSALLDELVRQLLQKGARFYLGVDINKVVPGPKSVELRGPEYTTTANQLYMSSRAHAPIEADKILEIKMTSTPCETLIFLIGGGGLNFDGYVEVFGNETIKRCRNVSGFVRPALGRGQSIINIQLRKSIEISDESASLIFQLLIDLGLLSSSARLIGINFSTTTLNTLSVGSIKQLNTRFGDVLNVLESTDFADCLESRLR